MTDKTFFTKVSECLFTGGVCKTPDKWQTISFDLNGKRYLMEALLPSRGNIRVRKPVKRSYINIDGDPVYLYTVYRFTNKLELVGAGLMEDTRPEAPKEAV